MRLSPPAAAALIGFIAAATIVAALAFQYLGGYAPCPLCLQERWAYYVGIPLAVIALLAAYAGRGTAARILLALVALAFLINTGLGIYHAGVEWHWWPGPATCGTVQDIATGDIMQSLNKTRVIACDQAAWRFLGLSFAGWNAVISALLMLLALLGALSRGRNS